MQMSMKRADRVQKSRGATNSCEFENIQDVFLYFAKLCWKFKVLRSFI